MRGKEGGRDQLKKSKSKRLNGIVCIDRLYCDELLRDRFQGYLKGTWLEVRRKGSRGPRGSWGSLGSLEPTNLGLNFTLHEGYKYSLAAISSLLRLSYERQKRQAHN